MHIGLTCDLRAEYLALGFSEEQTAEFDREETVEAIEDALRAQGHVAERIGHARALVGQLATGKRWDLVFNICEGMYGNAREAQVPALLDIYCIPYTFSDPLVLALTLNKSLTKRALVGTEVPMATDAVIETLSDLDRCALPFPLFVKPISEGTGKGIDPSSVVWDSAALRQACADRLERFNQSVLVETFLGGRELTVGIIGTKDRARVLGTLEIMLRDSAEAQVYSYRNKEQSEEHVDYRLVRADNDAQVARAEQVALSAWRALGCRDGGRVDLRCDATGEPHFLEVNPLPGLHPTHSDLPMTATAVGVSYSELIGQIVRSAALRRQA